MPKTLDQQPPAGVTPATVGAAAPAGDRPVLANAPGSPGPGGAVIPTADDFLTKLVKYVPLEILGTYLFIEGAVESNVTARGPRSSWLGAVLIGTLLLTIPYNIRVLSVVRSTQIIMSLVGLAVYVFAAGGWFATTSWYEPWHSSIVVPLFVLLVAIVRLKPLPPAGA